MVNGDIGDYLMLLLAFIFLIVGMLILRVTSHVKKLEEEGTLSGDLEHLTNSGIFVEHGMVRSGDGKTVSPQSKKSSTFLNCIS